jgi:hypothetical protein
VAILLMIEPWTWRIQPEPPPVLAEFVMPPAPKPAAPPPAPAPTVQPPRAVEELKDVPSPSVPQLQHAPVTREPSRAPPSAGQRARPQASERPQPAPMPDRSGPATATAPPADRPRAPSQQVTGNRQRGAPGAASETGPKMTQSESDFFLSQIVSAWVIDFDSPRFADIRIFGRYRVLADGMLAPPFGKDEPWDMGRMVENWDQIATDPRPEAVAFRTAVETFLRAMRLSQPLKMPPNAEGYPKVLELNFRIGDM